MGTRIGSFLASGPGIAAAGGAIGLVAILLQEAGNPPNMGICVACFERDLAGALGLHRAAPVQYLRPEIPGFVLGSMAAALAAGEFRARAGAGAAVRFLLGMLAALGALVHLGCPWRAFLRLAGGDGNALVGLAGLAGGVAAGTFFLRGGYTLGRSQRAPAPVGAFLPLLMAGALLLLLLAPQLLLSSAKGPGSQRAPLGLSLGAAMAVGALAQRTRFCTMGAFRDLFLIGNGQLLGGVAGLTAAAFLANLALGRFHPALAGAPVAHSAHLWNLLGMVLAGLAYALAGGCPGRQLFLAGEGDGDAAVFVLGMIGGAALAHNLGLTAAPDQLVQGAVQAGGPDPAGQAAVLIGLGLCLVLGFTMRESRHG